MNELAPEALTVDPTLQPRVDGLDVEHVRQLQDTAETWPPLVVVRRGGGYLLVDGFHRLAAAQNLALRAVPIRVMDSPEDGDLHALAFALNAVHGRPLTLSDRRSFAVRRLQQHPSGSNLEVARRAGLSPTTVAALRERLEADAAIAPTERRVSADGRTYIAPTAPRPAGTLAVPSLGEQLGSALGRLFTPAERMAQRRTAEYLQRLAVALDDQARLVGWADAPAACRAVLGSDRAAALGQRLGTTSEAVLAVAVGLGYHAGEATSC